MKRLQLAFFASLLALPAHAQSNFYVNSTNGNVGIGSTSPMASLDLSQRTDAIILPIGTSGDRPATGINGMLRYNATSPVVEAYINNSWAPLLTGTGVVTSISGDGALISNSSSTGSVTLALANVTAKSLWGNNSSITAIPSYTTSPVVSGSMTADTFVSTAATGTAPFTVSSTTNVANLNASYLNGTTFAAPGSIGNTTPGSGAFTTLSASGSATLSALSSAGVVTSDASGLLATNTTLPAAEFPALTGDVTTTAGSLSTTVNKIQGTTVGGTTGSGNVVFSTSPTLTGTVTGASSNWSGNVGIGTTSPHTALQVNGSVMLGTGTCSSSTTGSIQYSGSAVQYCNGTSWTTLAASTSQWITSGSNIYYTSGVVSIGTITPSPDGYLTVDHANTSSPSYYWDVSAATFRNEITEAVGTGGGITLSGNYVSSGFSEAQAAGLMARKTTAASGDATFGVDLWARGGAINFIQSGNLGVAPSMSIATNGNLYVAKNVGIGTSIPPSALSVIGGAVVGSYSGISAPTNGMLISGDVGIGTSATSADGYLTVDHANTTAPTWYWDAAAAVFRNETPEAVGTGGGITLAGNYLSSGFAEGQAAGLMARKTTATSGDPTFGLDIWARGGAINFIQTGTMGLIPPSMVIAANYDVGIGTTLPIYPLDVAGTIRTGQALLNSSAVPTLSSCGTTPTATAGSNNNSGQITLGTGTPTGCAVTFANAFPNNAYCTVTPASNYTGTYYISAQSKSAFTVTMGTGTASVKFNYTCGGN